MHKSSCSFGFEIYLALKFEICKILNTYVQLPDLIL